MVVYLARRIKMGKGDDAPKPGAAHLLPDAPIIYRFDPLIDDSILRMAATASRARSGFPPECTDREGRSWIEVVPQRYSAALTRAVPGGFASFQSPGARTLLAERISMPRMRPSPSTS